MAPKGAWTFYFIFNAMLLFPSWFDDHFLAHSIISAHKMKELLDPQKCFCDNLLKLFHQMHYWCLFYEICRMKIARHDQFCIFHTQSYLHQNERIIRTCQTFPNMVEEGFFYQRHHWCLDIAHWLCFLMDCLMQIARHDLFCRVKVILLKYSRVWANICQYLIIFANLLSK